MLTLLVTQNVNPFMGLDGRVWRLRKGDVLSVNPGLPYKQAAILVTKNAGRWLN